MRAYEVSANVRVRLLIPAESELAARMEFPAWIEMLTDSVECIVCADHVVGRMKVKRVSYTGADVEVRVWKEGMNRGVRR